MKLKSTYYICEVKCLIYIYRNCPSKFDRAHGPLSVWYPTWKWMMSSFTGFLQVFCSKIPWLFQSWNDNLFDIIKTITLSQKWNGINSDMQTTDALVGESGGKAPWSWNTLSFWMFNGSHKFGCFLIFGDAKNHSYLQSAWSKIIFPDFSKIIFSLDISLTLTDNTNSLTFSSFSLIVGTLFCPWSNAPPKLKHVWWCLDVQWKAQICLLF